MILQLSQRVLTDAETFTSAPLLEAVGDAPPRQVVGGELHPNAIARQDADEVHPQLSADVREHAMLVLQFDGEHGVRERFDDRSLNLDRVLLGHRRTLAPSSDW